MLLKSLVGPIGHEFLAKTSGQSYKQFTLVNYDARVVLTWKLLIIRL